jgi:hypothetical protein
MELKHGADNVHFEYAVPWPAPPALPVGELHVDVAVFSERLAIEAKNTVHIDSLYESAVVQVAGALVNAPDKFDAGLVVFLDHDYQITHEFPIFLTDELREQVETIMDAVVEAGKTGQVPERICGKPSDGIGHLCPFIEHCFEGWVEPPPAERGDLSELASEGWVIQRDLRTARGSTQELESAWEEWKARASEATEGMPPGLEIHAGPIRIKRIDVKGRETFSLSKARKSGSWTALDEERFGAFTKIGEPSVRFDLTKTEAESPLDIDYGDASHLDEF